MTVALPRPLEPWRPWLALLGPDLAAPLGQLLLQLHPLVGPLHAAAPSPDAIPAGVGSIVQRGSYERLLISEWAYADAAPDEFIRRAAGNELLFTGPEPQRQRSALRCIALFDAGPAQLGEPRLAHLALFILLARRAAAAGAQFAWGVLQRPGALHQDSDERALRALLDARTLARVAPDDLAAWERWCEQQDGPECWQLGAAGTPVIRHARAHVTIAPGLLDDGLALVLHQHHSVRTVMLALPPAPVGVRLLRHPFGHATPATTVRNRILTAAHLRPSALQAPRFGAASTYLATARMGGGIVLYHVPSSSAAAPAAPRAQVDAVEGSLLGLAVLKRNCGKVTARGDKIVFSNFPGELFRNGWETDRPPMAQFHAPSSGGRWLPTFFIAQSGAANAVKRILMLDIARRLVCWEWSAAAQPTVRFYVVAQDVAGVAQFGNVLVYARAAATDIAMFRWTMANARPALVDTFKLDDTCARVCFGGKMWGMLGYDYRGLLAWQTVRGTWRVRRANSPAEPAVIDLSDGASVIGVAAVADADDASIVREGLVVLARDDRSIWLYTGMDRIALVQSELTIAQAALDPTGERLAWISTGNHALSVRHLSKGQTLLCAVSQEHPDGA